MDSASSSSLKENKKAIGIIWLTVFIDLVGFSIIFPLFPEMLNWYLPREEGSGLLSSLINFLHQVTPTQSNPEKTFLVSVLFGGILGSVYSLIQFFASPIWGHLSDIKGRRAILLITTTGTLLAYGLWIFAGAFWVLVLSRIIGGFMAGNLSVATAAIADLTDRKNRSKGMALIGVAFGLGFVVGPAIGGISSLWLWESPSESVSAFAINPFSAPAFIAACLACLNVILVWKYFPKTPVHEKTEVTGLKRLAFIFGSKNPFVKSSLRVYFLFIFAFAGMEFTLTFLALERLFYDPSDMVKMFVFIGIILILTQGYVVRKYAQKVGERNFVVIGLLSGFLGLIALSLALNEGLFYLGLALLGFGISLSSPSISALVSLYANDNEQGTELGRFRALGSLGRAIGPISAAILFWSLSSQLAYLIGATILAFTAFIAIFLPQPSHSEESELS